jgi:hypothetical protein
MDEEEVEEERRRTCFQTIFFRGGRGKKAGVLSL